jgi:hypothetical protein
MKQYLIYFGSVLTSTLMFVLILSLCGILGPSGAMAAAMTLKVLGWFILYVLMVRIPIALIKANAKRKADKFRESMQQDADALIAKASAIAAKDTIKLPTIDNPITPMPADPAVQRQSAVPSGKFYPNKDPCLFHRLRHNRPALPDVRPQQPVPSHNRHPQKWDAALSSENNTPCTPNRP